MFTIKNQLVTSFSTLDASIGLKNELLDYQHEFFNNSIKIAKKNKNKYIVVGDKKDKSKLFHFYEILNKHKIEIKKLERKEDFLRNMHPWLRHKQKYVLSQAKPKYEIYKVV